jgi:hypothetical protein
MSSKSEITNAALAFDDDASDENLQALRDACAAYERERGRRANRRFVTVEAQHVRPGDRLFDKHYYMPDKWRNVTEVHIKKHTVSVYTGTTQQVFHPREGVEVNREIT